MNLQEIGDIVTPIDDPCQFNPAWRAIVAGHLFSSGVHTIDDFKTLAMTGCITVKRYVKPSTEDTDNKVEEECNPEDASKNKRKQVKAKKKAKEQEHVKTVNLRVSPFYECPQYRNLALDKWIQNQVLMIDDEANGRRVSDEHVPFKLAMRWYEEPDNEANIKKRIEPLLLTEISMDIITLDLTGMPSVRPALEVYEKLYFNCRDESFNRSTSMQLIQRLAMPWGPLKIFCRKWEEVDEDGFVIGDGRPLAKDSDIWRAVAATMGYETLMYLWRWDRTAHGIKDRSLSRMIELSWNIAVSRLMTDLYSGEIKHEDAAKILSSYTSQSKLIEDTRGGSSGGSNDTTKALMAVLYQTSPKMIAIDDDASGDASRNDEIQSRISSQLAITNQKIEDRGSQVEHEVIEAQLANAINIER